MGIGKCMKTKKIFEVHRKVDNNVGDFYCNPSRYFDLGEIQSGELMHNDWDVKDSILVIGGGGLIHKKFSLHIEKLINKEPRHVVLWGIGHNFGKKHISKSTIDPYYPKWLEKCDLIGIRDYIQKNKYLPCVSCMHTAFDKEYEIKNDVVYFTHKFKSKHIFEHGQVTMANNEMDFNKVIEFIASGRTVVTDSYHGAYWAQLLGRDVRVHGWSVKFNHFKYPPTMLDNINQDITKTKISSVPNNFLHECRNYNKEFYNQYCNLVFNSK